MPLRPFNLKWPSRYMHVGEGIGALADAERFRAKAAVPVVVKQKWPAGYVYEPVRPQREKNARSNQRPDCESHN
jgi:hypothetical protein